MNRLEDIRTVTDKALYGLTADESLKFRILQKAAACEQKGARRIAHPVPVLCAVVAFLVIIAVSINGIQPVEPVVPGEMTVFAAGGTDDRTVSSIGKIESGHVISVEVTGIGTVTDPSGCDALIGLLKNDAESTAEEPDKWSEKIVIRMDDGSVYEYKAAEPCLDDGRNLECPAFFSMMHELLDEDIT